MCSTNQINFEGVAEVILSIRGKQKIVIDGFVFKKTKNRDNLYYWVCDKSGVRGSSCQCRGTANTIYIHDQHVIRYHDSSKHNHAPEPSRVGVTKCCNKIKTLALITNEKPCTIVRNVISNTEKSIQPYLPMDGALKQQVLCARKKNKPIEPKNIDEINLPENFTRTLDGKPFVKIVRKESDSILLFTTEDNIKILAGAKCWIMDGTFKLIPSFFKQLYTIHGDKKTAIIPLAYALLTSKKERIYTLLFNEITRLAEELGIILNPTFILTDFEISSMNAIKSIFPHAKLKACFFHLCQNVYRKIQSSGLVKKYGSDETFSLLVRQIPCLAYLRPEEIPNAFSNLKQLFPFEHTALIEWFGKYYVYRRVLRKSNGKVSIHLPLFPEEVWSVYDNYVHDFPRTQNNVEAWHRRWQSMFNHHKVGLYQIITEIQKEQAVVENLIQKILRGEALPKQKRKDRLREERIKKILESREMYSDMDLLKALAQNISL